MAQVIRSPQAEEDLAEIWIFVAENNLEAADRLLDRINEKARSLLQFPEMGRDRSDLAPSLRSIPEGNYMIFYRIAGDDIEIVRVLHGARDIERIFSG